MKITEKDLKRMNVILQHALEAPITKDHSHKRTPEASREYYVRAAIDFNGDLIQKVK